MNKLAENLPAKRYETPRSIGTLQQVAGDIACLRIGLVNVFFLGAPGAQEWVLVDAGLAGSCGRIIRAAEERFGSVPPMAIILTHGHFDHVGALHALLRHWNVTVYAHRMEMPYLNGRSSYPPPDPTVGGGIMPMLSVLFPRKPIILGSHLEALPNDGSVPGTQGWRWVHTPGHSPGHVSLFREADRAMIAGDAFVTTRQASALAIMEQRIEVNGPPTYFTPDWDAARESMQHLAAMNPAIVGTGHGRPLRGEQMLDDLRHVAENFDTLARPARGRYVREPAVSNLHGMVSVPPRAPLSIGAKVTLAVLGVALCGWWAAQMRRPR